MCAGSWPHLTVHATESALLHDQVTWGLQEMGAEVTLLNVLVLIAAVPGSRAGSVGGKKKERAWKSESTASDEKKTHASVLAPDKVRYQTQMPIEISDVINHSARK